MDNVPKRSAKFYEARDSLAEELRPIYDQLVDEYTFHALTKSGAPWVAYKIIAALVEDGWRPSKSRKP